MKRILKYLFVTIFMIVTFNESLLSRPIKPLYEVCVDQYLYALSKAKTEKERKKVYEYFKKKGCALLLPLVFSKKKNNSFDEY